ncbi:MAG TPA: restriction endonuclease [Pirellulaceae bacterium]|nr:restriction endonuclease [Pirellulaceae bacterium]
MGIPDFQTLMLPLMQHLADGAERSMKELYDLLAQQFRLTEEEQKELLPSGQQSIFRNRVAWAKAHLKMAGIVESPSRGRVKLSVRGQEVLAQNPDMINLRFLKQFDEYNQAVRGDSDKPTDSTDSVAADSEATVTPLEQLESAFAKLQSAVVDELLDRLGRITPEFFEHVVVRLLQAMGYGVGIESGEVTSYVRDGGIDGIIREDKLGLDIVCIQAKRWQGTVGRPAVQAFVGSMDLIRAKKGVILTTGRFSEDATSFIDRIEGKRVVLIDGKRLAELMIEHDVGVSTKETYRIKEVSGDFFEEGLDG